MLLIFLLAAAALGLAATAEYFSVIGLATTYAGSFYSVVALGCAIGFGKLVGVSFLYRFWEKLTASFKAVLITIVVSMMLITSFGTFGFLTKANQSDMVGLKQTNASQTLLQEEAARLTARKVQIDQQIAQLKPDDVQGRIRLNRQFKDELKEINARVPQIEKEKAKLASEEITQQADIGPLVYLAKSLGLDVDIATTWFTLLLVIVLDPAAVVLTLCTNIAIAHRQRKIQLVEIPLPTSVPRETQIVAGAIRFNEEAKVFERYDGEQWVVYKPHNDNQPTGLSVTGSTEVMSSPITSWTVTTTTTEPDPVEDESTQSPALDATAAALQTMDWVPEQPPVIQPEQQSAFPALVANLEQAPTSTQGELDFDAPHDVEEQSQTGTLTNPDVAEGTLATISKDTPEYFSTDSADSLLDEVAIAQGPQPVVDTTGIEQNTFGQPNRVAWDNFVDVANQMANSKSTRDPLEFQRHLAQLQAYVNELDERKETINDDEVALRSRIIAFIQRHQPL